MTSDGGEQILDIDKLVDAVTKVIMERLNGEACCCKVVTFGDVPASILPEGCAACPGATLDDAARGDYVVLTAAAFRALHGLPEPACCESAPPAPTPAKPGGRVIKTGREIYCVSMITGGE